MFKRHKKKTATDFIEDEVEELEVEYKRFKRFSAQNGLLLSVFVLGITALVVINTIFWVYFATAQYAKLVPTINTPLYSRVVTSAVSVNNDDVRVSVKNVTTNSDNDPAFTIPSDQTMLIMDVTIKNLTDETQHLIPSTQFYVRSAEGETYNLHASMHVSNPIPAANIKANTTVEGQIGFAIPKRLDTPILYVDTGWNQSTPLLIDVLH